MADSFEYLKERLERNKECKTADSADFLKKYFNLSDDEFLKLLKKFPGIVSNSKQTLEQRIESYTKLLGLENQRDIFKEVYIKYPVILALPESCFKDKQDLYMINFGINSDSFKYIVVQNPQLLGDDSSTTIIKAREFIKGLNIASFQFGRMMIKNAKLLGYSKENIIEKCKKVSEFGLVGEFIQDPTLFATPVESFKVRYMLSKVCGDKTLNLFIQNENKSLVRMKYILEYNNANPDVKPIPLSAVYTTESRFIRRTGVNSTQLALDKRYKIDDNILKTVQNMYNKGSDESLAFTAEEKGQLMHNELNLGIKKPRV